MPEPSIPTFNLWVEPWIQLERLDGSTERHGIQQALCRAHEFSFIYEHSPLVVVGIHRLLTAILQDIIDPQRVQTLRDLWRAGQFPAAALEAFGERFAERFDLFSATAPFMQSADLSLQPGSRDPIKAVTYLAPELPAGSAVTHYHHRTQDDHVFCPVCAAGGLVSVPAFATSGGRGIKPSINGVPPIYVLPSGRSLFESLCSSLLLPYYKPEVASTEHDAVWWRREPVIKRRHEVHEVGYLHSLTFPARRIRLHPEHLQSNCTRCGQPTEWNIRTMVFQMGESRARDAPFWFDPFVAYYLPSSKGKKTVPTPIRPQEGRATWREFSGLFLIPSQSSTRTTQRPSFINQIVELNVGPDLETWPFRCIGMRTDMKAKIFEWIDASVGVPLGLLDDPEGTLIVEQAIQFATECSQIIVKVFRDSFGGPSTKGEHYRNLKHRMHDEYWAGLSAPFREFVLSVSNPDYRDDSVNYWLAKVISEAQSSFRCAAEAVGDDAASLCQRVQGEDRCIKRLLSRRKEYLFDDTN